MYSTSTSRYHWVSQRIKQIWNKIISFVSAPVVNITSPENLIQPAAQPANNKKKEISVNLPLALLCNEESGDIKERGVIVSESKNAIDSE